MDAYQQQVYSERMQGKKHKEIDIVAIILSIGMGLDSSVTAGRPVQLHVHLYMSM
jgi:predicted cation transporter